MDYGWPQVAMIVMYGLHIGMHLAKHGKPKVDTYNVVWALIGVGVSVFILTAGGFF